MTGDRPRRPLNARDTAEAVFKTVTAKPAELPPRKPSVPHVKEMVSLKIDRDVLDHFQEAGPGWQNRLNDVLRKVVFPDRQE